MSWNRWTERVLRGILAAALVGLVGCKQQLFIEPADYSDAVKAAGLVKSLETSPHEAIVPGQVVPMGSTPSTVLDPTRPPRYLTLKEAIAVAMEQGNVGSQSQTNLGFKLETATTFNGRSVGGVDAIRAFALDPAVIGSDIERSLSKFDARWITSMSWQKVDQPVAAQFLSFQQQRDAANFSSSLVKPLPTGGIAGITFSTDYSKFGNQSITPSGFVNPNYTPRVQFTFEQPLLQLFGVEVNQLTNTSPTSILISGLRPSGGQTTEGILLTRIRFDQSRTEFERLVNYLLVNVETAYWNLYASYYALYAQEEGLRQSYEGLRFTESRVNVGTDQPYLLNQARAQFEQFRVQVYRARGQVLESERQLRDLMGLRSDDGQRLVPVDEPNLAPFSPDFYEAANETIARRPELMLARQDLKAQQLNLLLQKNLRRPDLRFYSQYDIAGLGTRLDGSEVIGPNNLTPGNAIASLGNNQFNSWTLGLRLDMPLGFRDANAAVRQQQLQLTRSYYLLRNAELKALEYLLFQYRRIAETYIVLPALRTRRENLQIYVYRFGERIRIGNYQSSEYFNYLQVQRDLATAISEEFQAVAQYNSALAQLEFAKGTIQQYNNITLGEGALPPWVQKRATDHFKERTEAAFPIRQREAPPAGMMSGPGHPVGPPTGAPTLPPITEMPPLPNDLPAPRPLDPKMNPPAGNPMGPGALGPTPLTAPGGATGFAPLPGPAGRPAEDYFQPAGTVPTPQLRPLTSRPGMAPGASGPTVPDRGTGGAALPPVRTPPPGLTEVPFLPVPGGGGIPPTLPPVGAPPVPPLPTSPAGLPDR